MDLSEYRDRVRESYCPYCSAAPPEPCQDDDGEFVEYVHDNRSHAYHDETALPLLRATQDDEDGQIYVEVSDAIQAHLNRE